MSLLSEESFIEGHCCTNKVVYRERFLVYVRIKFRVLGLISLWGVDVLQRSKLISFHHRALFCRVSECVESFCWMSRSKTGSSSLISRSKCGSYYVKSIVRGEWHSWSLYTYIFYSFLFSGIYAFYMCVHARVFSSLRLTANLTSHQSVSCRLISLLLKPISPVGFIWL